MKAWREIIVPHKDVAEGKYQQAEFAANLGQVLAGNAESEYQDPVEFFERTYITVGIKQLLITSLRRIAKINGQPIVELKTAFGGGKTHTMIALYHLINSADKLKSRDTIRSLMKEAGVNDIPKARIAVLVGTDLDPTRPRIVGNLKIRTLWGEMAYQLGGVEGYRMVEQADQKSVAPGANTLIELFQKNGPCIILIDELVRYAGNIYGSKDLASGSFDSLLTFLQNLTEAVIRSGTSMLIASIPKSDIELGGNRGQESLQHIEKIFGRVEEVWTPVQPGESFEIVRRRLFEPVSDPSARDKVCEAFSKLYSSSKDFPVECKEEAYLQRMKDAYPIHPEVFDRLYEDWSTLEMFQRTRGVLRLMAAAIHRLWVSGDKSLLIMPGSFPLDDARVRNELTRYLGDAWNSIVDNDVDGNESEPSKLDQQQVRYGSYRACRRVTRTIFFGSAPSSKEQKNRGMEDVRILVGIVQPGEQPVLFRNALTALTQRLTYLYFQGDRYWYDAHPNLRKKVEDRAGRYEPDEVFAEINRRLHTFKERGEFSGVHIAPISEDVPDTPETRLVVLPLQTSHQKNTPLSPALLQAKEILDNRGDIPRQNKNMLLFLAADGEGVSAVERDTRYYLAWQSVLDDRESLNLDAHQNRQATENAKKNDQTVNNRLNDAYSWFLIPTQEGTKPIKFDVIKLASGDGTFISRASRQVRNEELLIVRWSPALLKNELDKLLWKDVSHISTKKVWDCFTRYPYLPRLKNQDVLIECIQEGLRSKDFFAYASQWDGKRYLGLEYGNPGAQVIIDDTTVLVKRDVANRQILAEEQANSAAQTIQIGAKLPGLHKTAKEVIAEAKAQPPTRFYGVITVSANRLVGNAGQIAEEVLQHLVSLESADIKVQLEIQADVPKGIPERTVRVLLENCRTLKFTQHEFEQK